MENTTQLCKATMPTGRQTLSQLIISKLKICYRNYRTRRHLSELPEHLWSDIGLEEHEVRNEIRKPFWRQ